MQPRAHAAGIAWGLVALSTAIGVCAYVAIRAATLSFTHDESFSYTRYVHDPLSSVLFYEDVNPNNHLLNTLAMKLAESAFGASELALRVPSVAAFVVYLVAIALLLRRVERRPVRFLGFSLAVANPYVLDFFSLARGYGLALALVAASALFTVGYVERPTVARGFPAVACAALAVLASFATLGYFLGVLLLIALALVVSRDARRDDLARRLAAAVSLPIVVVVLFAAIPLVRLRRADQLYVGGDDGFWQDTVHSLVSSTLYRPGWKLLEVTLVVLVAMAVTVGAVAAAIGTRRRHLPLHATAFILLATPAAISVVQHFVIGSLFLIERTALFLVPLFAVWLAYAADALAWRPRFAAAVSVAAVGIAVAAWLNLASTANRSYVLDWRYDASTEEMLEEMNGLRDGQRIDFGASWLFEPTINFYRETKRLSWLPPMPTSCRGVCVPDRSDYYYVIGGDVAVARNRGARVVRTYPLSGSLLLRKVAARG